MLILCSKVGMLDSRCAFDDFLLVNIFSYTNTHSKAPLKQGDQIGRLPATWATFGAFGDLLFGPKFTFR